MAASQLKEAFLHLSQHSVDSVQNGKEFTYWDEYMHVGRPIESKLIEKMDEIDNAGGGIVLLVGSAGDGKSHLISRIKQMSDWGEGGFYNDATASSSPKKTAIDTLKEALVEYKDENLYQTCKKLVLAINLGKLNALIDDEEFKTDYKEIVNSTMPIIIQKGLRSSCLPTNRCLSSLLIAKKIFLWLLIFYQRLWKRLLHKYLRILFM